MSSGLVTGARTVVYINGQPYSYVTNFAYSCSTPHIPVIGLDVSTPLELAPTGNQLNGTLGLLRASGTGGLEGAGVAFHYGVLPQGKYFSLAIIDRKNDLLVFSADRCVVVSQSWSVPAAGKMVGSMSFIALDWYNEATFGDNT